MVFIAVAGVEGGAYEKRLCQSVWPVNTVHADERVSYQQRKDVARPCICLNVCKPRVGVHYIDHKLASEEKTVREENEKPRHGNGDIPVAPAPVFPGVSSHKDAINHLTDQHPQQEPYPPILANNKDERDEEKKQIKLPDKLHQRIEALTDSQRE